FADLESLLGKAARDERAYTAFVLREQEAHAGSVTQLPRAPLPSGARGDPDGALTLRRGRRAQRGAPYWWATPRGSARFKSRSVSSGPTLANEIPILPRTFKVASPGAFQATRPAKDTFFPRPSMLP